MAAMFRCMYTLSRCDCAEVCPPVRIRPVVDAALILAVSVLVCLEVLLLQS